MILPRVRLTAGAATAVGRRAENEDAWFVAEGAYLVADGMGGHDAGALASAAAIEVARDLATMRTPTVQDARDVARMAHVRVRLLPSPSGRRPGSTLTGVVLTEHGGVPCWLVLNVGDSRTYRMAGGVLEQVTADHSEVAELVRDGVIPQTEAATHPRRNVVTRVLGGSASDVDPDVWLLPVSPGDRMLLCSDGLTDELTDQRIEAELRAAPDPQQAADRLVRAAVKHGARDNVTAVVVEAAVGRR